MTYQELAATQFTMDTLVGCRIKGDEDSHKQGDSELVVMASAGFSVEWGGSATGSQIGEPNMYSPVLDVGLGFGALPQSMDLIRPFAITAEVKAPASS